MITIPGIKRGELKESLKVDPNKVSRLSWSEQLLAKAITSYGTDIIRYNVSSLTLFIGLSFNFLLLCLLNC